MLIPFTKFLPHRVAWSVAGAVLLFAFLDSSRADVTLPAIFGNHMVLQEGVALPVWGTAAPGEGVTVSIAGEKGSVVADAQGAWVVKLAPLPANGEPVELHVEGKNALVLHDVLVGDVWVCSGQSNMNFGVGGTPNSAETIAQSQNPSLRLFMVGPQLQRAPAADAKGQWVVCAPEVLGRGGWGGFSAVGYFFGKEIQEDRKTPVGLIQAAWNGTPAEAWTSLAGLQAEPALAPYAQDSIQMCDSYAALKQEFTKTLDAWQKDHDAWAQQYGAAYTAALDDWKARTAAAKQNGQPLPPPPTPGQPEPRKPVFAGDSPSLPASLFNGMINPLVPFAIKGVVWDQGESNGDTAERAEEYATLFPALIRDWRRHWGEGNPALAQIPFLYVQLASFGGGRFFPLVREAQLKALSLPNTGMAVTLDIGEQNNIHFKDKLTVGHRLALIARHAVYGENLVASGPVYDSMRVEGNKARVTFKEVGGGLVIGAVPSGQSGAAPGDALQGFSIAGSDDQFVPAQASIDGDAVQVWSDRVQQPTAVRYGFTSFPKPPANLCNREGLPASPFRTDEGIPFPSPAKTSAARTP